MSLYKRSYELTLRQVWSDSPPLAGGVRGGGEPIKLRRSSNANLYPVVLPPPYPSPQGAGNFTALDSATGTLSVKDVH